MIMKARVHRKYTPPQHHIHLASELYVRATCLTNSRLEAQIYKASGSDLRYQLLSLPLPSELPIALSTNGV